MEIRASQPALEGRLASSGSISTCPSAVTYSYQRKSWTEGRYRDLNQVSQVPEKKKEVWRAYEHVHGAGSFPLHFMVPLTLSPLCNIEKKKKKVGIYYA